MKRFGITIPRDGVPLLEQRQWIQELVELGYTDLWTSEAGGNDGFTPLALASVWAPSVRLGCAVLPAYTRGPDYVGLALTGGLSINSRSVVNRQYSPEMGLQRAQWTRSHQVR